MAIAEEYAEYCTSLDYSDLPQDVRERTTHLLVDFVGNAIGASRLDSSEAFLRSVESLDTAGEGGTVLATGDTFSPRYAAFLNAAFAHSLDYDDTHRNGSVHPGAPVIAAALAAAEAADASGERLITGIVAGYETMTRLGVALNPGSHSGRGFHATSTCGVFGATAAIGTVSDVPADELETAFGLNGSQAAGSLQFLENGAWNKRSHPGLAALQAWISTTLASNDFNATQNPIDGDFGFLRAYSDDPEPASATAGLGETYEVLNTALKPYPCCRHMHTAIDAMLALVESRDVDSDDVRSIDVSVSTPAYQITGNPARPYPETLVDAQFSLPFAMALALTKRDASVDSFLDAVTGDVDPELRRVVDSVTVTAADWIDAEYPGQWIGQVTLTTGDGTFEEARRFARGEPENPMEWADVSAKYDRLTDPVLGDAVAQRLKDRIRSVENSDARNLVDPILRVEAD